MTQGGRDWTTSDYKAEPEKLQIGQVVSFSPKAEVNNNKTIDSNVSAVSHYYLGKGEPVNLGVKTVTALLNSPEVAYNEKAIAEGTAKSPIPAFSVNLTGKMFHVGRTRVEYLATTGTKFRVVTFTGFARDGFWDPTGDNDGSGPGGELPGGTVYHYNPFVWTKSYDIK